jgi:hypothetical protein
MAIVKPLDFNNDGISDILWRNTFTGALTLWELNGSGVVTSASLTSAGMSIAPSASWSINAISDFTGDHQADIVWRNAADGQLNLWTMNGSVIANSAPITDSLGHIVRPGASWSIAGDGDFNADTRNDLLWRNTDNSVVLWTMNGSTITSSAFVTSAGTRVQVGASWTIAGIGDVNGDGDSDVVWRNSTTNELVGWLMNGSTVTSSGHFTSAGTAVNPDASWSLAGVGDFNLDGNADLLWRSSNGTLAEWLLNGSTITSSEQITFNGSRVQPDATWKMIEVGDFNGDGRSDLLWRNQNTGAMAEWLMNGSTITASISPTLNALPATLDGAWQPQAKPTDFA